MATVAGSVSIVSINGYSFYEFIGNGTINFSTTTTTPVLIVAGGGGGGGGLVTYESAGGGGGGGVGYGNLTFVSGQTYTITVGSGGTGGVYKSTDNGTAGNGSSGSNSSIVGGSIDEIAYGGGRGGSVYPNSTIFTHESGGSSGGGAGGTIGTPVRGSTKGTGGGLTYLGNVGAVTSGGNTPGSGGGGALNAGTVGITNGTGGKGGNGFTWSYTNQTYGGGGGGGFIGSYFNSSPTNYGGMGGTGGGGMGGGASAPTAGTAKTGGGGGGASSRSEVGNGASGGSGVVYIVILTSVGTAGPNITSVQSAANSLVVSFTGSVGAVPAPYYFYSVNGGTFANSGFNSNTTNITIGSLTTYGNYRVQLMAVNSAGNVLSGNSFGFPYVVGTAVPTITNVQSGINSLVVSYTGSQDAYPAPYYYYSVNGATYANSGLNANTNITITNLAIGGNTRVQIMAANPAGNLISANAYGFVYSLGTNPNIISVTPQANSLAVSFNLSVNGYESPTYYYSLSGNTDPGSYVLIPSANIGTNPNTFVINGLTTKTVSNISLLAVNSVGNVYSQNTITATPYVLGNVAPSIFQVYSNLNSMLVSFAAAQNAFPEPYYFYTVYDVSGTVVQSANSQVNSNASNIFIPMTTVGNYTVSLTAVNPAGSVVSNNTANGFPYILGTQPNINSVVPGANSLTVSINLSTGGYPEPTYYYSVSGNIASNYIVANPQPTLLNANTFVITGLTTNVVANVSVLASNPGGNVYSGNTFLQTPYVVGNVGPSILQVYSNVNSLLVSFSAVQNAYPVPFYYYSISGGIQNANTGLNSNIGGNLYIPNLSVYGNYAISLTAVSPAGNLTTEYAYGIPYVVGTQPTIISVANLANCLSVSFQGVSGWYPAPTYYYSINGNLLSNFSQANVVGNIFLTQNIYVAKTYSVYLFANNLAGYSYSTTIGTGNPYVLGTVRVTNVNNGNLVVYYPFKEDLLNYATGTGENSYGVSSTVSYIPSSGNNTVAGVGSAYFSPTNVAGIQPIQNVLLGTNGATVATWLKVLNNTPSGGYTRIFEFVNQGPTNAGYPFFTVEFNSFFTQIIIAFENAAIFTYPFAVDTNWHHYCLVISSSGVFNLYVDNVSLGLNTYGNYAATFTNTISSCYVGGTNTALSLTIR